MSVPQEKIQRALEAARKDGNQDAVKQLEGMLGDPESDAREEILSGQTSALGTPVPVIDSAIPDAAPALSDPNAPSRSAPGALPEPEPVDPERELSQTMYDNDQELIKSSENRPSGAQVREFMRDNADWRFGAGQFDSMQRQVVIDPKTGKPRWTALSPDQMDQVAEREKNRGTTTKALMGSLGFGSVRPAANILQNVDSSIEARNAFQRELVNTYLPEAEQERIKSSLINKYGKDHRYVSDPGLMPANELRELIDQNPENEKVFEDIAGDEWWEQRKEFYGRLTSKVATSLRNALPFVDKDAPVNPLGADVPGGALFGREGYEDINYNERGAKAPAYAGASEDLKTFLAESKHNQGIYESVIKPLVTSKEGVMPGDQLMGVAENIIKNTYTEEQQKERQMPFFSEDVQIEKFTDIFNADLYTDPNTKLPWQNPEAFMLTFFESAPEMGLSMAVTRGAGAFGAREGVKGALGQTISAIDKARMKSAGTYGLLAGSGTEGYFAANAAEAQTKETMMEIPIERYREDSVFMAMVDSGMNEESAKQVLASDAANMAFTATFAGTVAVSGPMNKLIGQSAAGRLIGDQGAVTRKVAGTLGEMGSEGMQGLSEQLAQEMAVVRIDPDNPIFDNPNRYLEAFGGEALVAGPFGLVSTVEPNAPVGIAEADVEVARATTKYMQATNDRFKWQTKIADPEHIANTSPNQRMADLEALEVLQKVEAQSLLDAEPVMRKHLEAQNTQVAQTELKMLNALKMRANAMLNDIYTAKSRRTTAGAIQQEEQRIVKDRMDLQQRVNKSLLKLEDLERQSAAIESIQKREAVDSNTEAELIKEGYAKRSSTDQLVILPKGKRAVKELNRQARGLKGRLEAGYIGTERRNSINAVKREMVDSLGPAQREVELYQDTLTGAQNRRAFNERQENIDVREGNEKTEVEGAQPAVAAVDVDSLAWVNDNMSHSAGDRLLLAVADAIGNQEGVEVFRLGGDEFAVTGASEEALETALQAAAKQLGDTEIAAGEDAVTPQITWGKGKSYEAADAQAISMKEDRVARGKIAGRKKKAATYKHRKQQGLFQMDGSQENLPKSWRRVSPLIERGDTVEVLTPDGAVHGTVTNVSRKRGRARVKVFIQGRSFTFNPESNHLIVAPTLSPSDLAWITGDADYADPSRETLPQTLSDIQIGFLGKDGEWYADMADDVYGEYSPDPTPAPWWTESYADLHKNYSKTVYMAPKLPKATQEEYDLAVSIKDNFAAGNQNLPPINIVRSIEQLEKDAPHIVAQIRAEGGSLTGVRGYMDHINPNNGVYVFVANISGIVGSDQFQQGIAETIIHEVIGHYGVRGIFGDEAQLRPFMHNIVDSFPDLAKHYAARLGLDSTDPGQKQLLGEEMVAYIAGEQMSGKVDMTPKQKVLWQRILDMFRKALNKMGLNRWSPVKKWNAREELKSKAGSVRNTKAEFWNDKRIQSLLQRSQDFNRSGPKFSWTARYDSAIPFMRDRDIFRAGLLSAIEQATYKPTNNEKKTLIAQGKYPDKQSVPAELALFPDYGSPNIFKQAIIKAQKEGWMTARELELSGLDPSSDFYFFRDASYATLHAYLTKMNGGRAIDGDWYKDILPAHLANEIQGIYEAMEKQYIQGPMPITGTMGYGESQYYEYAERPSLNKVSTDLMRERIAEILAMKIDPKKTRLTKELLKAHMLSENVYRVFVEQHGGHAQMNLTDAQERVFGNLTSAEVDALTPEQLQLVKDEKENSRLRGPDIGYNKDLDRWLDWAGHTTEYSEWSPQGSRFNRDFRVALVKSEGRDGDMGYSGHYDANMMHIRTGVASLLNWDGMPELEYPNPDMQGKMLSLIELQSDWLQKLRKGFASGSEKDAAERSWRENKNTLSMVADQLGSGVSADLWTAAANLLRPITNLPSDSFADTRGSMFEALKDRTRLELGQQWEDITDDQKRQQWKNHVNAELTKVSQQVYGAIEFLETYSNDFIKGRELSGTIDARSFEVLDKMAVKKFAQITVSELTTLAEHIQNTLTLAESQKDLVDKVVYVKSRMGSRLNTIGSGGYNESMLRLPMAGYVIKPMLDGLYEQMGGHGPRVAELMSGLAVRDQATVRVPTETISDLNRAMTSSYVELELVDEIISPSRISAIGNIAPGTVSMKSVIGGDGFVDIKVIGNKADIEKAAELVPKLFETWIQEHGSEKLRINRANRQQSSINTDVDGDYNYDEIQSWLDLTEEDTDEPSTEEMRNEGVDSYEDFEEEHRDEIETDHMNTYFDNMSEGDWDEAEGDPIDGVSRSSSEYRDAIEIDEDGDADNTAAEDSLREARQEYLRDVIYELDDVRDSVYEAIRELWYERGPTALIHGSLPTSWDEDGDSLSSVQVMIIAKEAGDAYDIYIDGYEVDYGNSLERAKEKLSESILEWYRESNIRPPSGELFGPEEAPSQANINAASEGATDPNWDIVTSNIVDNLAMISDKPLKLAGAGGVFETMVTLQKKLRGGINKPSPLADDKNWRPIALKYLIADAVRRGLGGVMWNNGLSSSTRGGMGLSGVTATDRITWSKESTTVRGLEQEVYVIRYAESSKPFVVTANRMIPALGADVARLIRQQEMGKIEIPEMPGVPAEDGAEPNVRDKYIIADANGDTQAIYRRSDNRFLGFASTEAEIDGIVTQDADRINRINNRDSADAVPVITGEPFGEVLSSGLIDSRLAGGQIHVMTGDSIGNDYTTNHTFGQPRLAGARQSYEDITVRSWNKELKKYGVHISDTYVQAQDMNKAIRDEAQPTLASPNREEQIKEEHGRIYVSEVTGGMHHWIVVSEKKGVIVQDVFVEKVTAERVMADYIENNYGSEREGVKVMYFPINEKMREEFSGPVAPFHYDPTEDPALKEATKKFGYVKTPLRERYVAFKAAFGHEFVQGALDQFYGLRKALNDAEVDDGAYISARLTTSLDSMMKGVLEWGHPVWKDGVLSNEGVGLLSILQPVMKDPSTWGMFMAGRRSKRLMMDGYAALNPEMRAKIDAAAKQFGTGPDSVFEVLVKYQALELYNHTEVQAGDLTKSDRAALSDIENKFWADFLPHTKREMQPKKGSTTKAPAGRWQIFDWRVPSKRNTQQNIDSKYRMATKALMGRGYNVKSEAEARKMVDRLTDLALVKQEQSNAMREVRVQAGSAAAALIGKGREHLFTASEIKSMIALGDKHPHFERVAKDYAEFNKKLLDFGQASGIIDPDTRPLWENADYVPFYRVEDDRLAGTAMSPTAGIANQRSPIRRLKGGKANMGDMVNNILMNVTKIVDASVKNNAALEAIDALRGSGIIDSKPMDWSPELIPMKQVEKVLLDKGVIVSDDKEGIHMSDIPAEALTGMQKMFAMKAPSGPGVVSVMRDGKKEYYYTDDMLLYRALTAINKKAFGNWIQLFSAPKRFLTTTITVDPAFMIANFLRDTGSAYVIGRDGGKPVVDAAAGFLSAITNSETLRTLTSAGASFENGYITGGDPNQTKKLLKRSMKSPGFVATVLDSPFKLGRAWKMLGGAIENSNRIAVYNAAIAAGKSKKRAIYEAKDLMDFSMGGDNSAVRFLIQTVPFLNARAQGNYRLARGANENPKGFMMKGMLVAMAGMALFLRFKDDERYEALEMWDKHAYFHFWIGESHYRLPKPFEVGAIFNTIPEMMMEYYYSKEPDDGKTLLKGFGHLLGETFSMSPLPQTVAPMFESGFNHNFFTGRPIVGFYESKRMPPEQYRSRTSTTMIELAKKLPVGLDTVSGKIRSPMHLQNFYQGYTGTMGKYLLQASDWAVQRSLDYPLPPAWEARDYPAYGRFVRGDNPPRTTKYQGEVYRILDKVTAVQSSLNFLEKTRQKERFKEIRADNMEYIRIAKPLEKIREAVQNINRGIQHIQMHDRVDEDTGELVYTPEQKRERIDALEEKRNDLFKRAYDMRPGTKKNAGDGEPVSNQEVMDMIGTFGIDDSLASQAFFEENAPDTYELLQLISSDMGEANLKTIAKAGNSE